MKFDTYDLIARVFPAVLSSVPFFILHYFLLQPAIGEFWGEILAISIASNITFSFILLFLLMHLNRIASKEIYEKYFFKDGLCFPTTNFLLHADSYFSHEYTMKIHKKIKSDFGISIPSGQKERIDEDVVRQHIREAMSHIRAAVGKGKLVGSHNTEYGFIRNFAGGNVIATLMSLINIIIFTFFYPNPTAYTISLVIFLIYLTFSLFSKKLIDNIGKSYAKVLIQEYMA